MAFCPLYGLNSGQFLPLCLNWEEIERDRGRESERENQRERGREINTVAGIGEKCEEGRGEASSKFAN